MTLFYDPQKRKVKPWVVGFLVIAPIVVIIAIFIFGRSIAAQKAAQKSSATDIFAQ